MEKARRVVEFLYKAAMCWVKVVAVWLLFFILFAGYGLNN